MNNGVLTTQPEWEDDDDMDFLYASFPRSRGVKPASWDAKMEFWRRVVQQTMAQARVVRVVPSTLREIFARDGVAPAGLDLVLGDMYNAGDWLIEAEPVRVSSHSGSRTSTPTRSNRSAGPGSSSTLGWLVDTFVASPIKWATGSGPSTPNGSSGSIRPSLPDWDATYVSVPLAAAAVAALVDAQFTTTTTTTTTGPIAPRGIVAVATAAAALGMETDELVAALRVGAGRDTPVALLEEDGLLKFAGSASDGAPGPATETELGIVALETMATRLRAQYDALEAKIAGRVAEIKALLVAGHRPRAAILLRGKKHMEQLATARLEAWDKVHSILEAIDDAATSAQLVETYRTGTAALAALTPDVDDVHNVLDDLADALADQTEVDAAIAAGNAAVAADNAAALDIDDDDLIAELEALSLQDNSDPAAAAHAPAAAAHALPATTATDTLPVFPSVPDTDLAPPQQQSPTLRQQQREAAT